MSDRFGIRRWSSQPSTPGSGATEATYRQAAASADHLVASQASNDLGRLLTEQGDIKGACAAFHEAIRTGPDEVWPKAAVNLAMLLRAEGDHRRAREVLERVAAASQPEMALVAGFMSGLLLREEGDAEGARAAFQRAFGTGLTPAAAIELAGLLDSPADAEDARAALGTTRVAVGAAGGHLTVKVGAHDGGRRQARAVLAGISALASSGAIASVELDTVDELLRYEAWRAGFVVRLRAPLACALDGDGTSLSVRPPPSAPEEVVRLLESLSPRIAVRRVSVGRIGGTIRRAVSGLRAIDYTVELADGGPALLVRTPDRPDLMPEAVAQAVATVIEVRRRFGAAVHHVRRVSFDHSERGLRAGGQFAGMAHLATGDVHLNASSALADVLELHRWEFPAVPSGGAGAGRLAFSALEATTAHELWHNIEAQLEGRRFRDSMELRRQLGSYFGVETLEHAVEARGPGAPAPRQRARALLMNEVSPYAGTSAGEATAELFRLWWCSRDAPPPVARHFGQAIDRFFPPPEG